MPLNKLQNFAEPLVAAWGRLTAVQKAAATLVGLVALVALVASVRLAGRPEYAVLFSNLSANDANAIVEKLKENKVTYRVTNGGSAIEVPNKDVYETRLQMAGEGLPQGSAVGFELFDKSSFGMTEFTQRLNYQRALQGELARTIGQLGPVSQARVHVAIPEDTVYSDRQSDTTASVVLKLRPNSQINEDQVAAITRLVSASVEGLKPENVAVVDAAGNLLSEASAGPLSAGGLRLSASQHQMQRQYEAQAAKDLQGMLDKVLGPGKAIVRVNARMDFNSKQTESQILEPIANNRGVLTREERQQETYSGAGRSVPAPALTDAFGAPGGAMARTTAQGDNYVRTQSSAQYEVSKRVEHIVQAPGRIERLSVAVLIDGNVTADIRNTVENTVSVAVGLDPDRGDQVTVNSLPFDTSAADQQTKEMEKAASREMVLSFGKWGVALALAVIFLFFLRSILASWRPVEITQSYPTPLPLHEAEALADGPLPDLAGLNLISEEPAEPVSLSARTPQDMAREDPAAVARLIRAWLSETD